MPTISVDKQDLYESLGKQYTTEEFDELCFEFGIELDEDTENDDLPAGERPQLKIEIPANRYDMLCFEGISRALNTFLGRLETLPKYTLTKPSELEKLYIEPSTAAIRPYAAAAILRDVVFTERRYESFIALQDKLHTNLCRNRTLVAIGTHDLDTIKGPFTYKALPPKEISFVPLNQSKEMNGEQLMEFYESDRNLGKYLHIIRDSPVYPVIYDSQGRVCSLPPIINGDHSKISLNTKNVLIEVTATDKTKVEIVLNQLVAMFSEYCGEKYTIEPVEVVSPHNGESRVTPNVAERTMPAEIDYINSCLGLKLSGEEILGLLKKMMLTGSVRASDGNILDVLVPCTRSDILHQCDIMEDTAIGYGFNNLQKTVASTAASYAAPLPINKISDILRRETAMAGGWLEVMPLTLCSHDENFKFLLQKDDRNDTVKLANPKTAEYQVVRTSLLPGLLKTVRENKDHFLPIKVFESGDIVLKDESLERKAFNQRHWAALQVGKTSGFEVVKGLLDRIMKMMRVCDLPENTELDIVADEAAIKQNIANALKSSSLKSNKFYWITPDSSNPTFFPGRSAKVCYATVDVLDPSKVTFLGNLGVLGVLHPDVVTNFEVPFAGSYVEINCELLL